MQRKNIDEAECAQIEDDLIEKAISPGEVRIVMGKHALYGAVVLIQAGHNHVVLANDVRAIVGKDDTLDVDV